MRLPIIREDTVGIWNRSVFIKVKKSSKQHLKKFFFLYHYDTCLLSILNEWWRQKAIVPSWYAGTREIILSKLTMCVYECNVALCMQIAYLDRVCPWRLEIFNKILYRIWYRSQSQKECLAIGTKVNVTNKITKSRNLILAWFVCNGARELLTLIFILCS